MFPRQSSQKQEKIKTLPLSALSALHIKAHQISLLTCMWSRCQTGRLLSAFLRGSHCAAGPQGSLGRAWAEAAHAWSWGWAGILGPIAAPKGTHSIAFTLRSLETEALQVILLLLLIAHLPPARTEHVLHFYNSRSLFLGISPLGSPSLLLPLSISCSSFMTQLQCPSSWKSLAANFRLRFFL